MWKCDPSNIQNCLNCQYAECRRVDRLYDPVSDELDRAVKYDSMTPTQRYMAEYTKRPEFRRQQKEYNKTEEGKKRQIAYNNSIKCKQSQSRYAKNHWREHLEKCKGVLYGVISNYYSFFGKEPSLEALHEITGHRRTTIKAFVEQLRDENMIELDGERIRLLGYWDD